MGKNYRGRLIDLKERLNKHLYKLTHKEKDFFSELKQNDLIELKSALSDINNVLTFKATNSAAKWICNFFRLNDTFKKEILHKIDGAKPNTNGYDINISYPKKIIAEVKCIVPINDGSKYGAAQWSAILDDAIKLKKGKASKPKNTKDYIKFLFLIDLGERTDSAISILLRESKGTSDKPLRADRHKIKKDIVLFNKPIKSKDLELNKIYLKKIKI